MKHFLKETDFSYDEAAELFNLAVDLKKTRGMPGTGPLSGQTWAMLFYKESTRTRVSFEVGINELGGHALILDKNSMQLSRGESIADTARILSRYVHGLVIRTYGHHIVEEFADDGTIPVVNALTDLLHPCQIYSDALTLAERWANGDDCLKSLKGKKLAFLGDCAGNMANSWILGGAMFGMEIALSGPDEYQPDDEIMDLLKVEGMEDAFTFTSNPEEAVTDADVVYTDVWISMGVEDEKMDRVEKMTPYQVNNDLLSKAKPDSCFMHCLPAHPGMEVTRQVLESPNSIIFDQAENRLHMQKAIMSRLAQSAVK